MLRKYPNPRARFLASAGALSRRQTAVAEELSINVPTDSLTPSDWISGDEALGRGLSNRAKSPRRQKVQPLLRLDQALVARNRIYLAAVGRAPIGWKFSIVPLHQIKHRSWMFRPTECRICFQLILMKF